MQININNKLNFDAKNYWLVYENDFAAKKISCCDKCDNSMHIIQYSMMKIYIDRITVYVEKNEIQIVNYTYTYIHCGKDNEGIVYEDEFKNIFTSEKEAKIEKEKLNKENIKNKVKNSRI